MRRFRGTSRAGLDEDRSSPPRSDLPAVMPQVYLLPVSQHALGTQQFELTMYQMGGGRPVGAQDPVPGQVVPVLAQDTPD